MIKGRFRQPALGASDRQIIDDTGGGLRGGRRKETVT